MNKSINQYYKNIHLLIFFKNKRNKNHRQESDSSSNYEKLNSTYITKFVKAKSKKFMLHLKNNKIIFVFLSELLADRDDKI